MLKTPQGISGSEDRRRAVWLPPRHRLEVEVLGLAAAADLDALALLEVRDYGAGGLFWTTFDPLRDDPRFQALLARVGLAD